MGGRQSSSTAAPVDELSVTGAPPLSTGRWAWEPTSSNDSQPSSRWRWSSHPSEMGSARTPAAETAAVASAAASSVRTVAARTPSTTTPQSTTHGFNSQASPDACSEASSSSCQWFHEPPPTPEQCLSMARQHANNSLEALRLELQGFGGATAVRYAMWPPGAPVEVLLPPSSESLSMSGEAPATAEILLASVVKYHAFQNSFEVRLHDGSTRVVPATRVQRSRDHTSEETNSCANHAYTTSRHTQSRLRQATSADRSVMYLARPESPMLLS